MGKVIEKLSASLIPSLLSGRGSHGLSLLLGDTGDHAAGAREQLHNVMVTALPARPPAVSLRLQRQHPPYQGPGALGIIALSTE